MIPSDQGQLVADAGITTYDKGKNGRNAEQPSNACHQNNIMIKPLKIACWNVNELAKHSQKLKLLFSVKI
jgi:hypothetical protein